VLRALLDVLYPPRCAGCGDGAWPFCLRCIEQIVPLGSPCCLRCAAPRGRETRSCGDCPPEPIGVARAAFLFDGPVRAAVHRLKFSGWRRVAEPLGSAMASTWRAGVPDGSTVDAVSWVPLSRRRLAERGFDQARLLAEIVGRCLAVPATGFLRRTSDAGPQARRGREERLAAMLGRFRVRGSPPPRVLLVDDVLTTGATAAACAEALVAAGSARVDLLTAARALSRGAGADILTAGSHPGLWLPGGIAPR
jgi:competence protein ComFC